MQLQIASSVFEEFPQLRLGVLVVHDIQSITTSQKILDFLEQTNEIIHASLKSEELKHHPAILDWHTAYKSFGAKPKKHLPSVENLLKRTSKQGVPSSGNALVDLYNTLSARYVVAMGAQDLDNIQGGLQLTYASDNEKPVIVLGETDAKAPKVGEVIYKDEAGVTRRRWNWREATRTTITGDTKNAVIFLEGLASTTQDILENALFELAQLLREHTGAQVTGTILNKDKQSVSLHDGRNYTTLSPVHAPSVHIKPEKILSGQYYKEQDDPVAHAASDEHQMRLHKAKELQSKGIEPWACVRPVSATTADVRKECESGLVEKEYTLSGRVMTMREHGKAAFCDIQDIDGRLQLYVRKDVIGEEAFAFLRSYIDSGDIVWCKGTPFVTKMGELTIRVSEITLASKCLHPLPEKFHGLVDQEIKYRQRYLDLMTNPDTRKRFQKRSQIVAFLRNYFDSRGYWEVETPMLHPIPGGAAARPFVTHHNALDSELYLRIAPELYLKRLVVGGIEKVYEINRNFRNEGISTRHNPEFTMLEFYTAHKDYHYIMDFVENMTQEVVEKLYGGLQVPFGEKTINFGNFRRLSPKQAVIDIAGLPEADLEPEVIDTTIAQQGIKGDFSALSYYQKVFVLFEECAEAKIVDPTFIVDFPIEISPLAKRDPKREGIAARFELFVAGMELSNGFNELNDPFDQAERFKEQAQAHAGGDDEAMHYDADYVTALEYGMPPAVGVGIGIDRLVMLLTNTTSIKEVILFPTLKRKQ